MNIDKVFYKTLLKNLFSDPCKIRFWDGEVVNYGEGESKFEIIFNEPISKTEIINFSIWLLRDNNWFSSRWNVYSGHGYTIHSVSRGAIPDIEYSIYFTKKLNI